MKIAVNTRALLPKYLEEEGYFIQETFRQITQLYPQHEFLFIFDRPFNNRFLFGSNVKAVVAGPIATNSLLQKWWFEFKIPALLKKYKADVFVSCDGLCSLTTKVPQCLVVRNIGFLLQPSLFKKSQLLFYKKNMPKFLAKVKSVVALSDFSKKAITNNYAITEDKIMVVHSAADKACTPLDFEAKQIAKTKYTEGKEYFVYAGTVHPQKNLVNLLKAFSVFKKKQKTNMKLVLAGKLASRYGSFTEDLKSYKYRDDVVMTGYVMKEELAIIIGAAYGMVYPSQCESFGVPVLEAMHCQVPVITTAGSAMQELADDAALYANTSDYNEIADKMILLYKDENLRNQLINKGKEVAMKYDWNITASLLWNAILKAMS